MITIIVVFIGFAIVVKILSMGSDARRTRESQERSEKHAISQLPSPAGFEDIPIDAVTAVREANDLGAVIILHRQGIDLDSAKLRIKALRKAIESGPAFGRPPTRYDALKNSYPDVNQKQF